MNKNPASKDQPQNQYNLDTVLFGPLIGRGGFGHVYAGKYNDRSVAIKVQTVETTRAAGWVMNELNIWREMQYPGIVTLYGAFFDIKSFLVMESCVGDVANAIWFKPLTASNALRFSLQLLKAVNYLHGKNILHRDIKPENCIVNSDGNLKLADFGIAVHCNERFEYQGSFVAGTVGYTPPEVYRKCIFSQKSDIFSVGCTIFYFFKSRCLFRSNGGMKLENTESVLKNMRLGVKLVQGNGSYEKLGILGEYKRVATSVQMKGLQMVGVMLEMVSVEPARRPTCEKVLTTTGPVFRKANLNPDRPFINNPNPPKFSPKANATFASIARPTCMVSELVASAIQKVMENFEFAASDGQKVPANNENVLLKLKKQIVELQVQLQLKSELQEAAEAEKEEALNELYDLQDQVESLEISAEDEAKRHRKQVKSFKKQQIELEAEIRELHDQTEMMNDENQKLRLQLQMTETQLREQQARIEELEARITEQQALIRDLRDENRNQPMSHVPNESQVDFTDDRVDDPEPNTDDPHDYDIDMEDIPSDSVLDTFLNVDKKPSNQQ